MPRDPSACQDRHGPVGRAALAGLAALLVAGCGEPFDMQGRWAWRDAWQCKDDSNVLAVEGREVTGYMGGKAVYRGRGARLERLDPGAGAGAEGLPAEVVLSYETEAGEMRDRFKLLGRHRLELVETTIDGRRPALAEPAIGRELIKCPESRIRQEYGG